MVSVQDTTTERLIETIHSDLYGDDSRLPYVLSLCLYLGDRLGLSDRYAVWLGKELNGYVDYEVFQREFGSPNEFVAWMNKWAIHRQIETYVKIANREPSTHGSEIWSFPYGKVFVAHSVGEVARQIQEADERSAEELAVPFQELAPRRYADFIGFLREQLPTLQVPTDLRLFYRVTSLNQLLSGTRERVLDLLQEARQQVMRASSGS